MIMKLKRLSVIFCLLAGVCFIQLSAQSTNKAHQGWWAGDFFTEVYCNGEQVDYVAGTLKFHYVYRSEADYIWDIYQAKGEGVSSVTGENFKYKEIDKVYWEDGMYYWHYHLKGDMGSDYTGFAVWNMVTDEMNFGPTNCH